MTLREFAVEYQVPYSIVYRASCYARPVSSMRKDREFDRVSLVNAVRRELARRINARAALVRADVEIMRRMDAKIMEKAEGKTDEGRML